MGIKEYDDKNDDMDIEKQSEINVMKGKSEN